MPRRLPIALLALLACVGCLWRSYATILRVHVDVLTQTAEKLAAVVESGRGPAAEAIAEYVYPAKRAREFLDQFRGYSDRSSYRKLTTFLDGYEAMVRGVDAARAVGAQPDLVALRAERDTLQQLAVDIRAEAAAGR